jgi:hypothetical protein
MLKKFLLSISRPVGVLLTPTQGANNTTLGWDRKVIVVRKLFKWFTLHEDITQRTATPEGVARAAEVRYRIPLTKQE